MSPATAVLQASGYGFIPSISTAQSRQPPKGVSSGWEQSAGTVTPAASAARSTVVPAGTSTT